MEIDNEYEIISDNNLDHDSMQMEDNKTMNSNQENENISLDKMTSKKKLIQLINTMEIKNNGEIQQKYFVAEFMKNKNILEKSIIKDSYLPKTEWYHLNIKNDGIQVAEDENYYEIVLIRISDLTQPIDYFKELIRKEYKLNEKMEELYDISPKFKGFSISKTKVVSVFFTYPYTTLTEYAKSNSKKEIVQELIDKLELIHPEEEQCFLTPTLSPNNILWCENGMCSIIFPEIFTSIDSYNDIIKFKKIPTSSWFSLDFLKLDESNKCTLSYHSSLQSFGNILHYLLTGSEPPKSKEEWEKFFTASSNDREYNFFRDILKEYIYPEMNNLDINKNSLEKSEVVTFSTLRQMIDQADPTIFEKPIQSNISFNSSQNLSEDINSTNNGLSEKSKSLEQTNIPTEVLNYIFGDESSNSNMLNTNDNTNANPSNISSSSKEPIVESIEKKIEDENENDKNKRSKNKSKNDSKNEDIPFSVPDDKYLDGIVFEGINNSKKIGIIYIHVDVILNDPTESDIEIYDIYRPTGEGYKLLKYEDDNGNGTKYFSVVPFYCYNGMQSIVFGVRKYPSRRNITLRKPKSSADNNRYEIELEDEKIDKDLKIYNPIYKNELDYFRQISLINPKNFEYSYKRLHQLCESLPINNLVDIVLKTGFNNFTSIIINIIGNRNYSLKDISHYIDSTYKVSSEEYKNAPKLIRELFQRKDDTGLDKRNNEYNHAIAVGDKKNKFLCDLEIFNFEKENTIDKRDIISETINNLNSNKANFLNYINEEYCKNKIEEYNNSEDGKKKKIYLIQSPETLKKIKQISAGILSNIPLIIQGFTSAGKSFISIAGTVIIRGQYPVTTALSENTTVEDLLGRPILQKNGSSMMTFVPGILLNAYINGQTLILDECDLAKPEVLSCILASISKDEIVVNNTVYKKMNGYNLILTMNGEAEGFTKNQRNELTPNILSKFVIVKFEKMSQKECKHIFSELISDSDGYKKYVNDFVSLYEKMLNYKQKTVDPIVTLRNLKACIYLSKINVPVRFSAEIAYTRRFPKNERDDFKNILQKFGSDEIDHDIKNDIIQRLKMNNLYYDESYVKCAYLALAACKAGLHPLIIGKNGSGVTEFAKFIAHNYTSNKDTFLIDNPRNTIEIVQLALETSVDDLLGCFQPSIDTNIEKNDKPSENGIDLENIITWVDGPILRAGKKGNPVILDRIDGAKSQVIECLNPLLEENSVFNNVQFKLIEKNNSEQVDIGKGFIVIGTMEMKDGKEVISKALMNRFVAINLDDFELNSVAIEKITDMTIKKLNCNYQKCNQTNINNENSKEKIEKPKESKAKKGIQIFDFLSSESESESENDEESDSESNSQYDSDDDLETEQDIPYWYRINNFDDVKVNEISKFIIDEKLKFDNLKSLVKTITKLCYIIQRTELDISDAYNLLLLNDEAYNIDGDLTSKMLNSEDKNIKNRFFFNKSEKGNALKMILSLISCDLSHSPIFIQGTSGTGKSVAARHYGAYRKFRNRDPILTINCNSEISFEQFIGSFNFKNTSFQFAEGPLLTAMRNGEPILVDEINLCPENILLILLPLLKANEKDFVQLKGVPYPVQIKPGFLFIATGNDDNESGRKKMPQLILDELTTVKISNPTQNEYLSLLREIINNEYEDIKEYIIPENIYDIVRVVETVAQQNFSLRQIKCLLNRIDRFCAGILTDKVISNEEYKKIPVAYVIISFIIPGLKIGPKRIKQIIKEIAKITKFKSDELLKFVKSEVSIVSREENKFFVKKGKIILSTSLKRNDYPPTMKQIYFWIRMSCSLYSDTPSHESLLLEGPTSYKSYLLENWLELSNGKDSYEEHFVNKNTETQDLIGLSSLDDKDKLSKLIDSHIEKALRYLSKKREYFEGNREEKLKLIEDELNIGRNGRIKNNENKCLAYIFRCIEELIKLEENYDKNKGIKTVTSFNLGIIPSACIYGQKLIIKGIDQISPSVIERINSVLEYPRNLVLTEDAQGIFNNQRIFKELYSDKGTKKGSIPISNKFSIFFTSREIFNGKLSEAFKSRCTIINCPSYDNKLYLGISLNPLENYRCIAKSIIQEKDELYEKLIELYENICYNNYNIHILSFIRCCHTVNGISKHIEDTSAKHIVGIAALRSIFDGFDPYMRNRVINELLLDYLPENLNKLLTNQSQDIDYDSPFIFEKDGDDIIYVKSCFSNIKIQVFEPNIAKMKEIVWTKSAADMADAILTSLVAHAMQIFEGPPGIGKTKIPLTIFEALGINYERTNLSNSTTEEDIFSRTIPVIDENNNIKTKILEGPLYEVLSNSSTSQEHCRNGIIIDEINLLSDEVSDQLCSYLNSIFYKEVYHTSQGKDYKIGNIAVVATMNDAKLSNARTTLSSTLLNLSHTFKVPNFKPEEMKILTEKILGGTKLFSNNKEYLIRAIQCFLNSQKYINNQAETGGNTLREILKLREFTNKCPDVPLDTLLDLVLCSNMSEKDASNFKNENNIITTLTNIVPEIKDNKLCFKNLVNFNLIKPRYDGQVNKQFTLPEKNALLKILIGLNAKRTILLSGDIGSGKTYVVEALAEIIGVKLNVIQFNSETSSSDIIGRLEMSVDSNKVLDINNQLNELIRLLIMDEWLRVTSFINLIRDGNINYKKFKEFFEGLIIDYPLSKEAIEQLKIYFNTLKDFSTLSFTSFEFKKSLLINAMENGEWVLIDDVNYAPQEIERLMSLLEENSSLTIFEQNPPVIYSRDPVKSTDLIKNKQIHENFRLFVVTSNETALSAAIKSRCLCVMLKPFEEPKHYAELISSRLSNSLISDDYITSIAPPIGKAFHDVKQHEKENDYIISNYLLTPVNIVHLTKFLANSTGIDGKILSEGIYYTIFSMFKNKNEQYERFKNSLSSDIDFNITTINRIIKDKKYILGKIERKILEYAKLLLNEKHKNKIINQQLDEIFKDLYKKERISKVINIVDDKEKNILNYFKNNRNELMKNLESFSLGDIEEYSEYIDEVLYIMKKLIPNEEKIHSIIYYLKYFNSLLKELISIENTKIKGLKLCTIKHTKEYFKQFGDSEETAEDSARKIYWFRNAINGFNFLVPENVSVIKSKISIISIYYIYYLKEFEQLKNTTKIDNLKNQYIHLKMLENIKLREILKNFKISLLDKNILKLFNILVYYTKPISVEIGESANEELTIEINRSIVKLNEKEYNWNKTDDIQDLSNELGINNTNNDDNKGEIKKKDYYKKNLDYIIPNSIKINNEKISWGNLFWFYKLFARDYLQNNIINNGMLCEFNDAIEYILKINIFNLKTENGIWDNELENIINKGYQLIYSLQYLKNKIWEDSTNEDKKKNIKEFIKNIMSIKKLSELFIACESEIQIIKNIINTSTMIIEYFNKFKFNIWENMNIFINTCQSYIEEKELEEKFEKEKREYARELDRIKNNINNINNSKENPNFKPLYYQINKLKKNLNNMDSSYINNEINEILKLVSMFKRANENKVKNQNKSKILRLSNHNNSDLLKYCKILKKYSELNSLINKMKTINDQQLFINIMFRYSDISELDNFTAVFKNLLTTECANNEPVSNNLILELKYLSNSLLIIDIIKTFKDNYNEYFKFVNAFLDGNLDCIRTIGDNFGDDDHIYLPKFYITDLKYCVKFGTQKTYLIKVYINEETIIREPTSEETPEDYLKYLISLCGFKIENSQSVNEIINNINKNSDSNNLKKSVNNLLIAFKIIEYSSNMKYSFDSDWLKINNIDEMKNKYWKEPGKIIIKKKFNELLQFSNENQIFNGEKIIAKSLYATCEAKELIEIQYKNEFGKKFITEVLRDICKSNTDYDYGYRLISFYNKNIYKDNVAETMVIIVYTILNYLETKINKTCLDLRNNNISSILKCTLQKFIVECIEKEIPKFNNNEFINIIEVLLTNINSAYRNKFEKEKTNLKNNISTNKEEYLLIISEIENKVCSILNEKISQFTNDLNEYNNKITELISKYKEEGFFEKRWNDIKNIKKNLEDKVKEYYKFNKEKPFDYKYYEKLQSFQSECEILKQVKEIYDSDEIKNIIINDKKIIKISEEVNIDDHYINKYNKCKNEFKKNLEDYLNLNQENSDIENIIRKVQIQPNVFKKFNIDEEIKRLVLWIKELSKCNIDMKIYKFNENLYFSKNFRVEIEKSSKIYSANNNWIFNKENAPKFLLDTINLNLGIYILEYTDVNKVGSLSFDNSCSYEIKYKLEQDEKSVILAYPSEKKIPSNEPMNINFRLNKSLNKNETIKSEFIIKLLNNNNEEYDECKVMVYLNVIPLCLKFKLNEKYNIEKNGIININHYNSLLEIEHQHPGNYSSNSLGIMIRPNKENKYNEIDIKQEQGKIISNLKMASNKLQCSVNVDIHINKMKLLNLVLKFITPTNYGLIIYDENGKNIESIELYNENTKVFYLFNMSYSPISIDYHYNNNKIKFSNEIKNMEPGERKKLELTILDSFDSEELQINGKNITIKNFLLPKLQIEYYYYNYYYCCRIQYSNLSKIIQDKLKFVIINSNYELNEYKYNDCPLIKNNYLSSEIISCYLKFNNKIDENPLAKNNIYNKFTHHNSLVYGFKNGEFKINAKINDVDIALKFNLNYNFNHIFLLDQIKRFSSIINEFEFKTKLQSDNIENINNSIQKLLQLEVQLTNENIYEFINNLIVTDEKTSIKNIIKHIIKYSKEYTTKILKEKLMRCLGIMYKRKILIPYFEVNQNLEANMKQFLEKLSYIISFVDIVVNPGIINNQIINYINNTKYNNETQNKLDKINKELVDDFERCFRNKIGIDKESSDLIYYDNNIFKYRSNDIFEKLSNQIKDSIKQYDNNNYNKEKISDFIQTYKEEIKDTLYKITNDDVNISNLLNILDKCVGIIIKFPLIFSTNENEEDLNYCISKCQNIFYFINNLLHSPINKTDFSERIYSSYNEVKNILSNYPFFDLRTNELRTKDKKYNKIKSVIQCELPSDNSYENILLENKNTQENGNQLISDYYNSTTYSNTSQYFSKDTENYRKDFSYNLNSNKEKYFESKTNEKRKYKIEYSTILTNEEREAISIPFLNDNVEKTNINKEINDFNINDIMDYENTNKEKTISMNILESSLENTTPTKFLEMIMEKTTYKNQSLSEIKISKLKRKGLFDLKLFDYYDECSQVSSFIQSTMSNSIKSNLKFIENNKIFPNSILDSFVDIAVDITHMSQIQRITALIIATGISLPLYNYGVRIRISVFGERNGVWILSEDFSTDINIQLARLRDALACKKRYMSFPGDALYSLKQNWIKNFNTSETNYTSVLISSLISPQVVIKQTKWNIISNNIVVFGLKSEFDEEFKRQHRVYEDLLHISSTNKNQIVQQFLEPMKVVGQDESERDKLETLCNSLVTSCIYPSNKNDNFKAYEILLNRDTVINEVHPLNKVTSFIHNNMEDKVFFAQCIPQVNTDISKINENFTRPDIKLPAINEVQLNIQMNDNSSVGSLKNTVGLILRSQFGLAFSPNISAGKVPSASGGTLSIPALKKWIVSGFTYKEIFLKKANKTKRKYSITIAIDFSSSIHLSCNYSHAIATVILLLLAPSTIQDNEEIKIDVVVSTRNGPKIMFLSSKVNTFESLACLNSIINVIDKEIPKYCTPGNTLNAAYQLELQKGGVGMGKNIFFITDGYVTSKKEIMFTNSIIKSCENAGIDLITFGVGSSPFGLKQLYPKFCYAPSLRVLGDALVYLYSLTNDPVSSEIKSQVVIDQVSEEIQEKLREMIKQPPQNKELQHSIENKKMNYIEMMGNNDTMTISDGIAILNKNPEIEPYHDGLYKGFKILVVILYLGGYKYQGKIKDKDITVNQFEKGAGCSLRKKGFDYKMVFSYGEAIEQLTKSEGGRCPYIETWLFCSRGDGSLPWCAKDINSNKIIPFLKCLSEFNSKGGGLLLFCDNEPYTLETNLLISEYLKFEDEYGNKIRPKFEMKGNYNQPDFNKKYITPLKPNQSKNGKFKPEIKLPPPGKCNDRLSLRPGLIKFNEGITLSYAECPNGLNDYSPFIPFAYLTDMKKERPFILYYDPKMKAQAQAINQGPIVIHGGFTSAFYDFKFDGTGRLVTSIACWLVRYEERLYQQIHADKDMNIEMVKNIPAIDIPDDVNEKFTKWIKPKGLSSIYSIMILDVSGSMKGFYSSLIDMTNSIILNQMNNNNNNNNGTVIFFGTSAKAVIINNYRCLSVNDISNAHVGGDTNFYNAFKEATSFINPIGNYDDKRLLFLTDGKDNGNRNILPLCNQISNAGFSIHILGFGSRQYFEHLRSYVRGNGTFQVYNDFNDISTAAKLIFAAE